MGGIKGRQALARIIKILLVLLAVFLILRFALPLLLPFLLALLTARLIEPPVRFLMKKLCVKRSFAATVCCTVTLSAITAVIILACAGLVRALSALTDSLPRYLSRFSKLYAGAEKCILRFIDSAPPELKSGLDSAYDSIMLSLSALPGKLSARLLHLVSSVITGAPGILLFAVTYAVSVFFFSAGYPTITGFIMCQLPERFKDKAALLKSGLFGSVCLWLRAQLILMLATFAELSAAFLLARVGSPFTAALLITLVDALPVLGTGTVLIPWAALAFIDGNTVRGVSLALSYGVIYVVRSFLEPKIVSAQIGLHPLATLCSAYVGFRTAGIAGMIAAPLLLMMLKVVNDKSVVKLWKSPGPQ